MAVLVVGVWILIHTLGDRDYLYRGKPIYFWQAQMTSPVATVSNETRVVIQTEVIPKLTDVLFHDTHDSRLRTFLAEQLNSLPGVTIYCTPADGRRAQAAAALGELGPQAQAAIPDLIKIIKSKDEAVRVAAVGALGPIQGQPETVIPLLITCLADPQDGVPGAAVESLGSFGALSRPAWPKLVPLLKIRDKDMQKALRVSLKQIDPDEAAKLGIK